MHIEVNVTKNLLKHIYGVNDGGLLRNDCKDVGVHRISWVDEHGLYDRDIAPWIFSRPVLKEMNSIICATRFPTHYGASFRSSCKSNDFHAPHGLKSHDYHKMMQHVLPIAVRCSSFGPDSKLLRECIYELSTLFRYQIYFKFFNNIFSIQVM
jgi:hypothetical protein